MKKFLTFFLVVILLFSCGCSKSKDNDIIYLTEYSGKVAVHITKQDGLYYPTITGDIALSFLPSKLVAICADENIELAIKSVNRSNGLYILSFNQVHVFNHLEEKDYAIDMKMYYGGKVLCVLDFGVFSCDDEYSILSYIDMETGETGSGMDKESNWTPYY